jgi:transposase
LGKRKSQKLLAGVEPATGKFAYRGQSEYFNAETYIAFLDEILLPSFYKRNHRIYLIQDNASYHKAPEVYAWFKANRKRLEVFLLPPYSPEFNGVEQIWRYTRKKATHNRYFDTVEELCEALFATFDDIQQNPESILGLVSRFS